MCVCASYRWPTYRIPGKFSSNEQVHGLLFLCFHLLFFIHSFHTYRILTWKALLLCVYLQIYCSQHFACSITTTYTYICTIHRNFFPGPNSFLLYSSSPFDISTIWTIAQTCCTLKRIHTCNSVKFMVTDEKISFFCSIFIHIYFLFFSLPSVTFATCSLFCCSC